MKKTLKNRIAIVTGGADGIGKATAIRFVDEGATVVIWDMNSEKGEATPAIMDISNMGYGMTAATLNASKGIIPNRLNAKIGTAIAMSNVEPVGGGYHIGTEVNGNISYNLGPFMSVELHGAYLSLGNFYDSKQSSYGSAVNGGLDERPANPWTAFLVFKWFMF